ncbi:hypothetical protein ACC848_38615 [Rhizobium johnstonii]|jgi:hypothetical protein
MTADDLGYYRHRVVAERTRAAEAATPDSAAVHHRLAHLYQSLIERLEHSAAAQDLDPPATGVAM